MMTLESMLNLHEDFEIFESPCESAALRFAVKHPPITPLRRSMRDAEGNTVHNSCRGCTLFRLTCGGVWEDSDVCPKLTEL